MISQYVTASGLTDIAEMLDDPIQSGGLKLNDWHDIAIACLNQLNDAEYRPLLRPHFRRIYQIAVKRMAQFD
jgi:hypothetical protein